MSPLRRAQNRLLSVRKRFVFCQTRIDHHTLLRNPVKREKMSPLRSAQDRLFSVKKRVVFCQTKIDQHMLHYKIGFLVDFQKPNLRGTDLVDLLTMPFLPLFCTHSGLFGLCVCVCKILALSLLFLPECPNLPLCV